MAPLRGIPQKYVPILRPRLIKPDDFQVRDAGHDHRMGVGIVHWRLAAGEGCGSPEPAVGVAEMLDGWAAFVFFRRVCDPHVLFAEIDVALGVTMRQWRTLGSQSLDGQTCSSSVCTGDFTPGGCTFEAIFRCKSHNRNVFLRFS